MSEQPLLRSTDGNGTPLLETPRPFRKCLVILDAGFGQANVRGDQVIFVAAERVTVFD
jgi:hypothetical protein